MIHRRRSWGLGGGMKRKSADKRSSAAVETPAASRAPSRGVSNNTTGDKGGWRHSASLERHVLGEKSVRAAAGAKDMTDLPLELLRELSVGHADPLEAQIVEVLSDHGGSANLDQILIGLFRKFQVIQKRRFLQNKVWRMIRKGRLHKTPGTRGVFSLVSERKNRRRRK
jgi:hypothetical protein